MRKFMTTMVGAALMLGAAVPAFAQSEKPIGLSGRIGLFLPTEKGTRNNSDDAWFAAGIDYKYKEMPSGIPGRSSAITFSLDYTAKNDYRTVPLLVNYQVRTNEFYFFGGLGIAFSRVDRGIFGSDSDTAFAYQLGLGYDFRSGETPLFVEGKFLGNEKTELNGFGLYAGIRF